MLAPCAQAPHGAASAIANSFVSLHLQPGASEADPAEETHSQNGRFPTTGPAHVFLFFSNRLGCLGSILVSLGLTLLLLFLFKMF